MIKMLHTSDWHLGKKLYRQDRHGEHQFFFQWLEKTIQEQEIDYLVIAGDIFDSPRPSHEAIKLYHQFLNRLATHLPLQIIIIAGNHDSGPFLEAPCVWFPDKVHLLGTLKAQEWEYTRFFQGPRSQNKEGLCFSFLPYFRNYELYNWQKERGGSSLEQLIRHLGQQARSWTFPGDCYGHILVAHHLFGPFQLAGPEQHIALSGTDGFSLSWFDDFDYLALGHIHNAQILQEKTPYAAYSGAPLAMRFGEQNQKFVLISSWNERGLVECQKTQIPLEKELLCLKLDEQNWQEQLAQIKDRSAWVEGKIKLASPDHQLLQAIHQFAKDEQIALISLKTQFQAEEGQKMVYQDQDFVSLFKEFHRLKQNSEVPSGLLKDFQTLYELAQTEDQIEDYWRAFSSSSS